MARPFDPDNFPYSFLEAFGNKETTIKRLRAGASNKSGLGGVLQTNNIHIVACDPGNVTKTLKALKESPATAKAKARFILATDGVDFEAENLVSGAPPVACGKSDFRQCPLFTQPAFPVRPKQSESGPPRRAARFS